MLDSPTFERLEALELQRKMLLNRKKSIEKMIDTIERTIRYEKGEIEMTNEEKFKGFDFSHNPYEEEARERWGDEAIDRSNESLNKMSKQEQDTLAEEMNSIFRKLASLREQSPESSETQEAIHEWYEMLSKTMGDHISLDIFRSLGHMYVEDERFTKNIDQFGSGLAQFMAKAMEIYAKNNS